MPTAVQIELTVDSAGAVTGIRAFDSAIKGSAVGVNQLDATLGRLNEHLDRIGQKSNNIKKIGDHSLSSLDKVRLLRDDFGIHLPRAMEKAISTTPAVMTAINAVGGALLSLGALEIFARIGEEAYSQISKIAGFTDAVKKAREEAISENWRVMSTPDSLSDAQTKNAKLMQSQQYFDNKRQNSYGPGWMGATMDFLDPYHELKSNSWGGAKSDHFGNDDAVAQQAAIASTNELRKNSTKLLQGQTKAEQDLTKSQIEAQHAQDGDLRGYTAANAAHQKAIQLADQEHKDRVANMNASERHEYLTDPSSRTARTENGRVTADKQKADAELAAKQVDLSRQVRDARIAADNEATNAALKGLALINAQEKEALTALRNKARDQEPVALAEETAAIHRRYDNERLQRLKQQTQEIEKMERASQLAGQTGVARTQAERNQKLQALDARQQDADTRYDDTDAQGHSSNADKERAVINADANAQILEQQRSFSSEIDALAERSTDSQMQGYARIRGEADRHIAELERKFNEMYGQLDHASQIYVQGQAKLMQGIAVVQTDAGRERIELTKKNADETLQLEQEAAAKSLSPERAKTAMLYAEYDARTRKLQEELANQEISQDDYNRRVAANGQLLQDELLAQQRETTEKLAGELDKFFKNPMEALKSEGEKAMAQSSAKLLMGLANKTGLTGAQPGAQGTTESMGGSLLDSLRGFGLPSLGPKYAAVPGMTGHAADAHASVLSIGMATIQIGSATIAGGATSVGGVGTGAGIGTQLFSAGAASGGSVVAGGLLGPSQISQGDTRAPLLSSGTLGASDGGGYSGGGSTLLGQSQIALSGVSQGISTVQQVKQLNAAANGTQQISQFGTMLSPTGKDGTATGAGSAYGDMNLSMGGDGVHDANGTVGGMGGDGATGATLGGVTQAVQGGLGVAGAYQKHSFISGTLGGAMSGAAGGAAIGMMVGGPVGAALGAAAGAAVGATIGFAGGFRSPEAEAYDQKTVKPALGTLLFTYDQNGDYQSSYSQLNDIQRQAMDTTNKMGGAAQRYYQGHIKKEIQDVMSQLNKEEKASRSSFTASTAQFHSGGYVSDFGDLRTSPTEGFAHLLENEFIVNPAATQRNPATLSAIHAGHDVDSMMSSYRTATASRGADSGGGGRTLNMNVHAIDSRSIEQFFRKNRGLMAKHLNEYSSDYGGEARA